MSETALNQIENLLSKLTVEEKLTVLERLFQQLRQSLQVQKQPQDLYGIWRDQFPPDFDVDSTLQEIRQEWKREWQKIME
ncbi:MAG TPA: hypothetical protein VF177_12330 [Anaerolineae bacterium]